MGKELNSEIVQISAQDSNVAVNQRWPLVQKVDSVAMLPGSK